MSQRPRLYLVRVARLAFIEVMDCLEFERTSACILGSIPVDERCEEVDVETSGHKMPIPMRRYKRQ